jgi:hypothetical protein
MNATKSPHATGFLALLSFVISMLLLAPVDRSLGEEVLYEQKIRAQPLQITMPVNVDGTTVTMIFDTGAADHLLDVSLASHLKEAIGKANLMALGGVRETTAWWAPSMTLGTWKVPASKAITIDLSHFGELLGVNVKGAFGIAALRQTAIEVNFDRERLRILQGFTGPRSASLFLPGDKSKGVKYVPAELDDTGVPIIKAPIENEMARLILDTGNNMAIGLRSETFAKLVAAGVIGTPDANQVGSADALGAVQMHSGTFTRGTLLGVDLRGFPCNKNEGSDTVGIEFLLNFNFVYDAEAGRFYFERRKTEPPLRYNLMLGAAFGYSAGHCRVLALHPGGGPAEDAGLRQGDGILKLGTLSEEELNTSSVYDLCSTHAGQTIEVEIARPGESQPIKTHLKLLEKQFLYPQSP